MTSISRRRVYAPPLDDEPFQLDPAGQERRHRPLMIAILALVAISLAGAAWNTYGRGGGPPFITSPGPYKVAAPAAPSQGEDAREIYQMMEGAGPTAPVTAAVAIDLHPALTVAPAATAPPRVGAAQVSAAGQGAFLAQIAALRSEAAAQSAWSDLAQRSPGLLQGVRMDVQRADLGAQGVYYRLRAGYFADREHANAFCDRLKGAGLACMVVSR